MYEVEMADQLGVLLVEDDAGFRDSLAQLLEVSGYKVTRAANGDEALRSLREAPHPHLILLDLMMPVKDGWQFRIEQKADPLLADIPVIAMSGDRSPQAAAIDAIGFLPKPVRPAHLVACIRELIGVPVPVTGFDDEEALTDRMDHSPLAAEINLCTLTAGDVPYNGDFYRITETGIGEYRIVSLLDGKQVGRFVGSPGSLWKIFPEEMDEGSIRAIIREAIDCGLILPTPPD